MSIDCRDDELENMAICRCKEKDDIKRCPHRIEGYVHECIYRSADGMIGIHEWHHCWRVK